MMKTIIASLIITSGLLVAGTASADEALLKKSNCMTCHKVEGKLLGPSFVEIANKYKGNASAADALEGKISKGGTGVWGKMVMPPNPKLSAEDIKSMTAYILTLAK